MLEIATKGASRLRDIVEDLLMVAKIEGGRLPLKLRVISMAEVISASLDEVRPFLNQRNVDIKLSNLDLLPKLEADFDRLQQCMTNLIGNAVKFTPDGGSINLSGRKVKIDKKNGRLKYMPFDNSILSADTYIEVVVEDTGIGIAKDHLEKIFDKFFELAMLTPIRPARLNSGGGTGLGFPSYRGIACA
jgi:signal transduction histidine kinase